MASGHGPLRAVYIRNWRIEPGLGARASIPRVVLTDAIGVIGRVGLVLEALLEFPGSGNAVQDIQPVRSARTALTRRLGSGIIRRGEFGSLAK